MPHFSATVVLADAADLVFRTSEITIASDFQSVWASVNNQKNCRCQLEVQFSGETKWVQEPLKAFGVQVSQATRTGMKVRAEVFFDDSATASAGVELYLDA